MWIRFLHAMQLNSKHMENLQSYMAAKSSFKRNKLWTTHTGGQHFLHEISVLVLRVGNNVLFLRSQKSSYVKLFIVWTTEVPRGLRTKISFLWQQPARSRSTRLETWPTRRMGSPCGSSCPRACSTLRSLLNFVPVCTYKQPHTAEERWTPPPLSASFIELSGSNW